MKTKTASIQLPEAFTPFLSASAGEFIARMEGRKLILEPKGDGNGNGHKVNAPKATGPALSTPHPPFHYQVADRRHKPDVAAQYGLSPTRLKVYKALYASKRGLLARDIMTKCKLPHGSVQQTLNWLRAHKLVSHDVAA